ncbi:MAG: alpha/beta hydrolase [Candidatus Rokubacteria bacterium]|nr:alpha/beta hydrolase [Candidatus Rokubacteria bacterium]
MEQPIGIAVGSGTVLEAAVAVPSGARAGVVVCHPHPLYGGDMHGPVVLAVLEACARAGLATLRFNFRGVGRSTGVHDGGQGEQDDAAAALADLASRLPAPARVAIAGYSFGAVVAAAIAAREPAPVALALVAPPLGVTGSDAFARLAALRGPVLVVAGSRDEYCPPALLSRLAKDLSAASVRVLDGADHFFGGDLDALEAAVAEWAAGLVAG